MKLQTKLKKLYKGDNERCGFVLPDGEIVEVENVSPIPTESYDVSGADIARYADSAVATWHTHPETSYNLSDNDYETFMNWPELEHFIVGKNGVGRYYVKDGDLLSA